VGNVPREPHPRLSLASLGFFAIVTLQLLDVTLDSSAITVMSLVVDDDDSPLVAQLATDASHDLIG
jgi:hypothetical protein